MASESLQLKEAHRILTRLRLDTSLLHLQMERSILLVNGRLCYPDPMGLAQCEVNYELLHEIDRQLRHINEVKGVEYRLRNWVHTGDGGWSKRKIRQ